jgi:hypothetical protein
MVLHPEENQQLFYFCKKIDLKMRRNFELRRVSGALTLILSFGLLLTGKTPGTKPGHLCSLFYGRFWYWNFQLFRRFGSLQTPSGLYVQNDEMEHRRKLHTPLHTTPGASASFIYARIAGDDYIMNSDSKHETSFLRPEPAFSQ